MEAIVDLSVTMLVLATLVMAIGAALQAAVGLGLALFVVPLLALIDQRQSERADDLAEIADATAQPHAAWERIEALADAGGVFVSNTVHDHVRDRLPFVFEDLGEQQVKNIARPGAGLPGSRHRHHRQELDSNLYGAFPVKQLFLVLLRVLCSEVCPGKAGMFSRRQSCRGKSQSPVVRIAEEMETEPSKPIDKISRGEITSHRAVSKENALWPRKK